ncbi:MAG: MmcQ/YjbR family DNA-binding protein [Chitinophagales bacterium]
MIDTETAREKFLSFPEVTEQDHFGKPSYRIKKKIFATLWLEDKRAMVKLSPDLQMDFCDKDPAAFIPVPGGWGRQGATFIELQEVSMESFIQAITAAWCRIAPKALLNKFRQENTKKE